MTEEILKTKLRRQTELDLDLVINENRSTMLSILEKGPRKARLSVHKMFLEAPDPVVSAIAHYVRGTRRNRKENSTILRTYIQDNLPRFDDPEILDPTRLVQKGEVYDLQPMYDLLNHRYFDGELQLHLTWFGQWGRNNRSHITFGQYHDGLKLIKMNRTLDDSFFPPFFVAFILYHEMVHAVVPTYVDAAGRTRSHGPEFKERERQFAQYKEAIAWEKANKKHFFRK